MNEIVKAASRAGAEQKGNYRFTHWAGEKGRRGGCLFLLSAWESGLAVRNQYSHHLGERKSEETSAIGDGTE